MLLATYFLMWCDIVLKSVFSLAYQSARNSTARGWAADDEFDKMAASFRPNLQTFKHRYVGVLCPKLVHINCNIDALFATDRQF